MKNFLLSLAVAAAAILTFGCQGDDTAPGVETANQLMTALVAGNAVDVYNEGSVEFRRKTSFEDFRLEASQLRPAPGATISWTETESEGGSIKLRGEVPRETGNPAKVAMTMVSELGTWRLLKFDVLE